jgi:hypothetical protein
MNGSRDLAGGTDQNGIYLVHIFTGDTRRRVAQQRSNCNFE